MRLLLDLIESSMISLVTVTIPIHERAGDDEEEEGETQSFALL